MKEQNNIDKLFRNHLTGFKEKAPPDSWNRLDDALGKEQQWNYIPLLKGMAAAIALLLSFGLGYYYSEVNNNQPTTSSNQKPAGDTEAISGSTEYRSDLASIANSIAIAFEQETPSTTSQQYAGTVNPADESHSHQRESHNVDQISPINQNIFSPTIEPLEIQSLTVQSTKLHKINAEPAASELLLSKAIKEKSYDNDFNFDKNDEPKVRQWSLAGSFGPLYSYRELSGSDNNFENSKDYYDNYESGIFSFSGGLSVAYAVNNWIIESGVSYTSLGVVNEDAISYKAGQDGITIYDISTSIGIIEPTKVDIPNEIVFIPDSKDSISTAQLMDSDIIQNFAYLEIPLQIGYKLFDKRIDLKFGAGISPGILVDNSIQLENDNNKYDIGRTDNLRQMIYNGTLNFGIGYDLSKHFHLNLSPILRYSLTPINKDSGYDYHPYSITWATGVSYNF